MIIGIDPGLNGGLCFLSDSGRDIQIFPMPKIDKLLDLNELYRIITSNIFQRAFLESAGSRPGQSCVSTFKFGRVFGNVEGILAVLQIPFTLVTPRVWTKEMHEGISGDDPKKKSLIAVGRLFPGIDLRGTEKSRVPHDGMVDALLIAEYGRRTMNKCETSITT